MATTIGVFDSGTGGLSVLRELLKAIPDAHYIYYSDNANCPYGDKSPEFVTQRACAISELLMDKGAQLIVVACNTATAAAISTLRAKYSIPFVGMEPAVKPAALGTQSGVIGVLATAGTLKGSLYLDTKQKYNSNVKIIEGVGRGFVELVEEGDLSSAKAEQICRTALQPLLDAGADRIVLGCTHYPFLLSTLRKIAQGYDVTFIDPAPAVAARAAQLLGTEVCACNAKAARPKVELLSSGSTEALERNYLLI
ncbi:MAG: glutamate racemase [Bacteroidales bacterium]|nr:glutamate racemase [Bacteroidales bacterium]